MCYKNRTKSYAKIKGGNLYPEIEGVIFFDEVEGGTEVLVEVCGLPEYVPGNEDTQPIGPHGFHIHENGICEIEDPDNPFESAGGHYNPTDQPHGSVYSLENKNKYDMIITNELINSKDGQD